MGATAGNTKKSCALSCLCRAVSTASSAMKASDEKRAEAAEAAEAEPLSFAAETRPSSTSLSSSGLSFQKGGNVCTRSFGLKHPAVLRKQENSRRDWPVGSHGGEESVCQATAHHAGRDAFRGGTRMTHHRASPRHLGRKVLSSAWWRSLVRVAKRSL